MADKIYTTQYNDLHGVDFSSGASNVYRKNSPTGTNMISDIGGNPMKRKGWKTQVDIAHTKALQIWSFAFHGEEHLIAHVKQGNQYYLKRVVDGDYNGWLFPVQENIVCFFTTSDENSVFNVISKGVIYEYRYNGSAFYFGEVDPLYVPLITIGCDTENGGGTTYEGINMLTNEVREGFLADKEKTTTQLVLTGKADRTKTAKITIKTGSTSTVWTYNGTTWDGDVAWTDDSTINIPDGVYAPVVDGEDNIEVQYHINSSTLTAEQDAFFSCDAVTTFEDRVWITGATGIYGNRVWYSDTSQDGYYPETNYIVVGSNDTNCVGLTTLGEYLGVLKEPSNIESTVYLVYSTSFDSNPVYACKTHVTGTGSVSSKSLINMENETLFLSSDGIYGLSATAMKNRSYYLNKKLTQEPSLETAVAWGYNGYYILCVNSHCYILDTRQKTSWGTEYTNYLYMSYYWDNVPAKSFATYQGDLWFVKTDGSLCKFYDGYVDYHSATDNAPVKAEWSTPLDDDGSPQLFKTLQKKGTVATLKPFENTSAHMWINADGTLIDIGEVSFNSESEIPFDCFFKKKVKKYKRLQFILRNEEAEPFMVQEITKSYIVQGYSKRKAKDGTFTKVGD